jgi:hypothetical protein
VASGLSKPPRCCFVPCSPAVLPPGEIPHHRLIRRRQLRRRSAKLRSPVRRRRLLQPKRRRRLTAYTPIKRLPTGFGIHRRHDQRRGWRQDQATSPTFRIRRAATRRQVSPIRRQVKPTRRPVSSQLMAPLKMPATPRPHRKQSPTASIPASRSPTCSGTNGADLTFATHRAADLRSEWQIQSSTSNREQPPRAARVGGARTPGPLELQQIKAPRVMSAGPWEVDC